MTRKKALILALVTVAFLAASYVLHSFAPVAEHALYDLNFTFKPPAGADSVVIVGIDDESVSEVGAFPWPRDMLASLFERIEACAPRAVALDFLFPHRIEARGSDSLAAVLSRMRNLAMVFRGGNISDVGRPGMTSVEPTAYKHRFLIHRNSDGLEQTYPYNVGRIDFGDKLFSQHATRAGFINVPTTRTTQSLRKLVHVFRAGREYYPSFAVAAASAFLDLDPEEVTLDGTGRIALGKREIPLAPGNPAVLVNYRGTAGTIETIPAADLLNEKVNPDRLKGCLVFVGLTDAASGPDFFNTPVGTQFPGVEIWANAAADLLNGSWVKTGGPLAVANLLLVLLMFPGCALIAGTWKKTPTVVIGLAAMVLSMILSPVLLRSTGYFWNPGYHIYACIMLLGWVAVTKPAPGVIRTHALKLEPEGDLTGDALPPPLEDDFLNSVPETETAEFVAKKLAAPGVTSPDKAIIEKMQKLGETRIVRPLGSGGIADVYLTWHPRMEVYRAAKVIKPGQNQQWLDRFETEIRIFANLNHANVVQCFGAGEWHGLPYLDMEYVPGSPLDRILKRHKSLPPAEVLAIGILVCRALGYAHRQTVTVYGKRYKGVIHRDLKPANILLSRDGRVKLTDFGIARPGAVSLHTMELGKVVGTLPYLSPEQIEKKALTPKTDLYCLGVALYEMVCGNRAFPQEEIPSLFQAKRKGSVPPLRASPTQPQAVIDVIDRAMAVKPAGRFESAADMGKALENVLHDLVHDKEKFVLAHLVQRAFPQAAG